MLKKLTYSVRYSLSELKMHCVNHCSNRHKQGCVNHCPQKSNYKTVTAPKESVIQVWHK